jgi:hypothetical protein
LHASSQVDDMLLPDASASDGSWLVASSLEASCALPLSDDSPPPDPIEPPDDNPPGPLAPTVHPHSIAKPSSRPLPRMRSPFALAGVCVVATLQVCVGAGKSTRFVDRFDARVPIS